MATSEKEVEEGVRSRGRSAGVEQSHLFPSYHFFFSGGGCE